MFWIILIVITVLIVIISLCKIAGITDEHTERMYKEIHKGDNDEDN